MLQWSSGFPINVRPGQFAILSDAVKLVPVLSPLPQRKDLLLQTAKGRENFFLAYCQDHQGSCRILGIYTWGFHCSPLPSSLVVESILILDFFFPVVCPALLLSRKKKTVFMLVVLQSGLCGISEKELKHLRAIGTSVFIGCSAAFVSRFAASKQQKVKLQL